MDWPEFMVGLDGVVETVAVGTNSTTISTQPAFGNELPIPFCDWMMNWAVVEVADVLARYSSAWFSWKLLLLLHAAVPGARSVPVAFPAMYVAS